jgi:hypothetical protein
LVLDDQYNFRLNDYLINRFEPYINWYIEDIKISKNNFWVALVVIAVCSLCFNFISKNMAQMSFFQYSFDPTIPIKLGLSASIMLAFLSIFTTYKKIKKCSTAKASLESEHALFSARVTDNSGPNDKAAFDTFIYAVDGIMAATNPEVVIAVSQANALKI